MMIRYDLHIISDSSDRLPWQQRKNSGHGWRSIPFTKALRHYDVIMEEPDKRRIILYYVMQVATGTEDRVEEQVRVIVGNGLYDSCFHPMRRMKKKFRGEWKEIQEKLLPGYVFIRSGCVRELYQELQAVPAFTKLLGKDKAAVVASGSLHHLQNVGNIILRDLVSKSGRKMEQSTQFVDGGDIDDPVSDVDYIPDMAGDQLGLSHSDGIAYRQIDLLGIFGIGDKVVLGYTGFLKLPDDT